MTAVMGEAFEDRCGDDHGRRACPICRDDMSAEFITRIEQAAVRLGEVMTIDAFKLWLDDQAASSR